MSALIIALPAYVATGAILTFAGPAARMRRKELKKLELEAAVLADTNRPIARWKMIAFSCAISLGIVVLWPILAISAARTERPVKRRSAEPLFDEPTWQAKRAGQEDWPTADPFFGEPRPPTADLERWVSEVTSLYAGIIPNEVYEEYHRKMTLNDQLHFDHRLDRLDFAIIGRSKGPDGDFVVSKIRAFHQIGRQTDLRFSKQDLIPGPPFPSFRLPVRPGDEFWSYSSSPESWNHLAGRAGLALVRNNQVIDTIVLMMN